MKKKINRLGVWPQGLVLVALGTVMYLNVWRGEFVADDYPTVVENFAVRNIGDWGGLWQAFGTRFLVGLSLAANYRIGGFNVLGYHLFNIVVHILNAIAVWALVRLILRTPEIRKGFPKGQAGAFAFFSALIFLCHPLQTQAAAYITQRAVSMATLFYLLTLIFYLQARLRRSWRFYAGAVASMAAGILTKEMIITLPLMLAVFEVYFFGLPKPSPEVWAARGKKILPFAALSGLLLILFLMVSRETAFGLNRDILRGQASARYFLTELNVLRTYLRLLFLPLNQNHFYDYPLARGLWEPGTNFSILLLAALGTLAGYSFRRRRLLSFAIVWFFLTTSVEMAVVVIVKRGVIYEHWVYLPLVGFVIFLSEGLFRLKLTDRNRTIVAAAVIAVLAMLTVQRNRVWQNEIVFWQDVVLKSSQKPLAHFGLGTAYQRRGYLGPARREYEKSLELFQQRVREPDELDGFYLAKVYNNLGLIHMEDQQWVSAASCFNKALVYDPNSLAALQNLGRMNMKNRQYRAAIGFFQKALRGEEDNPNINWGLALAYLALNDARKAEFYLRRSQQLFALAGDTARGKIAAETLRSLVAPGPEVKDAGAP